jgi:type IV fimbrial biogenesis protein FimT
MHPRHRAPSGPNGPGYSFIELSAVLAIAGILLAAATPSFIYTVRDNRIATQVNLLLANVHLARMEAIKRNQDVVLCRSKDGRQCNRSSRARTDWSDGWIVYVNPDGDKKRDPDEPLLQVQSGVPPGMTLRFNQWWRVIYHADGSARNGSFSLCDSRGSEGARTLVLFYTGRPRVSDRKSNGDPIDCD